MSIEEKRRVLTRIKGMLGLIKKEKKLSFSCGTVNIKLNEEGYVISAQNFSRIVWNNFNQPYELDLSLIGKHVNEISELLHKYGAGKTIAEDFDKVVLKRFKE